MPVDYTIPAKFGQLRTGIINPATLASLREAVDQRRAQAAQAQQEHDLAMAKEQRQNMLGDLLKQAVVVDPATNRPSINVPVAQQIAGGFGAEGVNALHGYMQAMTPPGAASESKPMAVPTVQDGIAGTVLVGKDGDRFIPGIPKPAPVVKTPAPAKPVATKAPTESQGRASFFYSRGDKAYGQLKKMFDAGYVPSTAVLKYLQVKPTDLSAAVYRKFMSDEDMLFAAVAPRALTAILRPESGAVIGPDEIGSYLGSYIPTGESKENDQTKIQALRDEVDGLRAIAEGRLAGGLKQGGSPPGDIPTSERRPSAPAKPGKSKPVPPHEKLGVKF